jgi:hypothetical protein
MTAAKRRIVVNLGVVVEDRRALEAAADLASWADAELAGLFTGDANLSRLAGLPFAAEIGIASATWNPLGANDVERMFSLMADRLQRRLAETAQTLALSWSFEVLRGAVLADVLASSGDAVVLAGMARNRGGFDGVKLQTATGPVAVFLGTGPESLRALEAARALARRRSAEVLVVIGPGTADIGITRHGTDAPVERILRLQNAVPDELAQKLSGVQALLWPASAGEGNTRLIEAMRGLLDCPFVLIR